MNHRPTAIIRDRLRSAIPAIVAALACAGSLATARAEPRSQADVVIGYVKTVQGEAMIAQHGREMAAQAGLALTRGAVLTTGASGSLGVTFKDDSIVALGARARLQIDDYACDPLAGTFKMRSTLSSGPLYYVPGLIARSDPDAVQITTPQGTMHVHGARLLAHTARVDVEEPAR